MKLIIAEKPSVAKSIASALGAKSGADGCFEGNGLVVSWCVGHLVSPMDAAGYDERFKKWRYDDLPILPEPFRYVLAPGKEDAFENLRRLMARPDAHPCHAGGAEREDRRGLTNCAPVRTMKTSISRPCAARKRTGSWGSTPPACSPSSTTAP